MFLKLMLPNLQCSIQCSYSRESLIDPLRVFKMEKNCNEQTGVKTSQLVNSTRRHESVVRAGTKN